MSTTNIIILICWSIVGIMQAVNCAKKTRQPSWLEYWCIYIVMMVNIIAVAIGE